jgi:hypothetical protein
MKGEDGSPDIQSFDAVINLLERRLDIIQEATDSTEPPVIYMTADAFLLKSFNKRNGTSMELNPNFRDRLAVTKPYKGNRSGDKPYHFKNLTDYICSRYTVKVANGLEADDLLAIDHRLDPDNTIICSRDKDLRMVPGRHYGWPMGFLPSFGPKLVDEIGYLGEPKNNKLAGGGYKFFCAQMLMGDTVDNIPGLPGSGPVAAFKLLDAMNTKEDLTAAVIGAYKKYFHDKNLDGWEEYFKEQASLLWIVRELDSDGNPVMFTYENNNNE